MKKCNKCGLVKDESEFGKNKRSKDGLHFICKTCKSEQDKAWNSHNREKRSEASKQWRKENPDKVEAQVEARKQFLITLKKQCAKCGEDRLHVIEFHHINPANKLFNISHAVCTGAKPKAVIDQEIKKCVCLCANCHAEYHWMYGNNPTEPVKSLTEYLSL